MSRVIESDESGSLTIPPEVLGSAAPHKPYVVQADNGAVHIEPAALDGSELPLGRSGRHRISVRSDEWTALAEDIGRMWNSEKSAAEIVSEARRGA